MIHQPRTQAFFPIAWPRKMLREGGPDGIFIRLGHELLIEVVNPSKSRGVRLMRTQLVYPTLLPPHELLVEGGGFWALLPPVFDVVVAP